MGNSCSISGISNAAGDHSSTFSIPHEGSVIISCVSGYQVNGTNPITCNNGVSSTPPTCIGVSCPVANIPNSNYSNSGDINLIFPQNVSVLCDDGYLSNGSVSCQSNGQLSSISLCDTCDTAKNYESKPGGICGCMPGYTYNGVTGACDANSCTPTQVANSDKSDTGIITGTTGQTVSVVCDTYFEGDGDAICQASGTFTTPSCTASNPPNGAVVTTQITSNVMTQMVVMIFLITIVTFLMGRITHVSQVSVLPTME